MDHDLEARLKAESLRLGFSLSGIAPATKADGFPRYQQWLEKGYAGEMDYLRIHGPQRQHPAFILENVRSVLMLGMEYQGARGKGQGARETIEEGNTRNIDTSLPEKTTQEDSSNAPCPLPLAAAHVASYAAGPDYHRFIWDRLSSLADWLMGVVPGCNARGVTDTAPLLERDFARRAGLGWVGKNTMLINPQRGSFFFLAALLTDLELKPDAAFTRSHCGTCTACLDACPTNAFPQPFVLDATKCISYLTIELRSRIPEELREPIGNWLFGCDICQDVCPWNRKESPGPVAFPHDPEMEWLDPVELLGLDADAFRTRFKKTSLFRSRRAGLLRNAAIVLGNVGDDRALTALEKAKNDPKDWIREAASWAIEKINKRTSK
jgi:epoxyqueuosine reductase